ncbi:uncharacterized protein VTP21DRAFT_4082 [Calcarisporiella thermophila]|uniref:uncharacterized protein n=1 Tax=Calcarisporiella thermophila TaxID=911321 RepID=UPI0037436E45
MRYGSIIKHIIIFIVALSFLNDGVKAANPYKKWVMDKIKSKAKDQIKPRPKDKEANEFFTAARDIVSAFRTPKPGIGQLYSKKFADVLIGLDELCRQKRTDFFCKALATAQMIPDRGYQWHTGVSSQDIEERRVISVESDVYQEQLRDCIVNLEGRTDRMCHEAILSRIFLPRLCVADRSYVNSKAVDEFIDDTINELAESPYCNNGLGIFSPDKKSCLKLQKSKEILIEVFNAMGFSRFDLYLNATETSSSMIGYYNECTDKDLDCYYGYRKSREHYPYMNSIGEYRWKYAADAVNGLERCWGFLDNDGRPVNEETLGNLSENVKPEVESHIAQLAPMIGNIAIRHQIDLTTL